MLPEPLPGNDPPRVIPERSYRRPPVVEALCEVYFDDSTWDDTIPGAFYERVKAEFPTRRQREIQEAQIAFGRDTASAGVQRLPPWMQFLTEKGDLMIQVAENLLVVNQMRPYPHFEEWVTVVDRALATYREVAQPQKVARVGLRYINRIEIPSSRVELEDYFTIYPRLPETLGNTHGTFLVRVQIPQRDEGHTMLITFGNEVTSGDAQSESVFMLDLYDIATIDAPLGDSELQKTIHQAHDNVVMAFEGSITDRLRQTLELEA